MMKKARKTPKNNFKEFFLESWTVYLVVFLVLLALGIFYILAMSGNILFTLGLIVFIIGLMMLVEFTMWKRGK